MEERRSSPCCVTIGCDSEANHQDKNKPHRTFCSPACSKSHQEMLAGQITRDSPLYGTISTYYHSNYEENKDYHVVEFYGFCAQMRESLKYYFVSELRVPMADFSYRALYAAMVDTFKSNKEDRARLIKTIIGSLMNFVATMKKAMAIWREKQVPDATFLVLASLFQWATFEQGQAEIKRWLPVWTPPVVLFRAVTGMSNADPFINMANIDYSSTVVNAFGFNDTEADKREKLRKTGGQMLNYNTYAVRSFGSESELADFSFLLKAREAGAQRVLVPHEGRLDMVDLDELYESATQRIVYLPRYATWDSPK